MSDRQNVGGRLNAAKGQQRGVQHNNFVTTAPDEQLEERPSSNDDPDQEEDDEEAQSNQFAVSRDAVEGTKSFEKAYDKLVKKFYNEEGANLLIPQEDMMIHEYQEHNAPRFNIQERQKKYAEIERRKQEKIRLAQLEKEKKEMEECSFAPRLYKKRSQAPK